MNKMFNLVNEQFVLKYIVRTSLGPCGLTFTWWWCCGLCFLTCTNQACPFLFTLFLCLYLSLRPFQLYFLRKFSLQLSDFSLCSSGLISAFLVLSMICLFVKVSLSPNIILCGSLGLKHQLTITWHRWSVKTHTSAFFQPCKKNVSQAQDICGVK